MDVVVSTDGMVYMMRLRVDGTVKSASVLKGSIPGGIMGGVAAVGDVDGNGVVDIVVGALEGLIKRAGVMKGAVYVLLMEADGGIGLEQTISTDVGGLVKYGFAVFASSDFGYSIAGLGDLDGDGIPDISVGAPNQESGRGMVYILLLKNDGSVKRQHAIHHLAASLAVPPSFGDYFGYAMTTLVERGDSDEGVATLVVGAMGDSSKDPAGGAVYILKLPPGFVELCPLGSGSGKCTNSGDSYTCG